MFTHFSSGRLLQSVCGRPSWKVGLAGVGVGVRSEEQKIKFVKQVQPEVEQKQNRAGSQQLSGSPTWVGGAGWCTCEAVFLQ